MKKDNISEILSEYAEAGLHVLPLKRLQKRPATQNGVHDAALPTGGVWGQHNIGVATGASCLVVLDVDNKDADVFARNVAALVDRFPELETTTRVRTPRGGLHFYLRAGAEPIGCGANIWPEDFPHVDLRGVGGYVVAPPSWVSDGPINGGYEWIYGLSELEEISPALEAAILEKTRPRTYLDAGPGQDWGEILSRPVGEGERNDAAARVSGYLLRKLGKDTAPAMLQLWNTQQCNPPLDDDEIERTWRSVLEGHLLREPEVDLDALISASATLPPPAVPETKDAAFGAFSREQVLGIPGVVGELTEWILATSLYPQPLLALGAALSAVATCVGRKVQTESGLRSNLYALAVAESTAGKSAPQRALIKILRRAGAEANLLEGDPASDTAFLKSIANHRSVCWVQDEFGKKLAVLNSTRAASYSAGLVTLLLELYSRADGAFGKTYADSKSEIWIPQPCVNLYAASTPETFYGGLSPENLDDGLIGRLIVLESKDVRPIANEHAAFDLAPPESAMAILRQWVGYNPNAGNLSSESMHHTPRTVRLDPLAAQLLREYTRETDHQIRTQRAKHLGRVVENGLKLAMVRACGIRFNGPVIDRESLLWGLEFARTAATSLASQFADIAGADDAERLLLTVRRAYAREGGWIPRAKLLRGVRISARRFDDAISTLAQREQVLVRKSDAARPRLEYAPAN